MKDKLAAGVFAAALALAALCSALGGSRSAMAQAGLTLPADRTWAILASTRDRDEAIAIAQFHSGSFVDPRVVLSRNGWLAVIAGPYASHSPERLTSELKALWAAPSDLFLSNGAAFVETVWFDQPDSVETIEFDRERYPGGELRVRRAGYDLEISAVADEDELYSPRLVLRENGRVAIDLTLIDSATADGNAVIRFARLDPASTTEDLIFTSYWMGAHCCTVTRFITRGRDGWRVVEGETLDGETGYLPVDLDGDGVRELVSVDNTFYYAYASYAGSIAPPLVHSLRDGRLLDRRFDGAIAHYYRRQAYQLDYWARMQPMLWNENGFLAAWVATKAVLGEFREAWPRVLTSYDRNSDWPLEDCAVALVDYACPPEMVIRRSFPEALRRHLEEGGYIEGPAADRQKVAALPSAITPSAESRPAEVRSAEPAGGTPRSAGTGFVVAAGRVLTNQHVLAECRAPSIRHAGIEYAAREIASDGTNDLALLAVDELHAAHGALRLSPRLGEGVAVFGYPLAPLLSSSGNFTLGNVTALSGLADDTRFLQISAPVQPGNSGGPLLDADGAILGVVTSKLNALVSIALLGDVPQNVNFAIKSATILSFLASHGLTPAIENAPPGRNLPPEDLAVIGTEVSVQIMCR